MPVVKTAWIKLVRKIKFWTHQAAFLLYQSWSEMSGEAVILLWTTARQPASTQNYFIQEVNARLLSISL